MIVTGIMLLDLMVASILFVALMGVIYIETKIINELREEKREREREVVEYVAELEKFKNGDE